MELEINYEYGNSDTGKTNAACPLLYMDPRLEYLILCVQPRVMQKQEPTKRLLKGIIFKVSGESGLQTLNVKYTYQYGKRQSKSLQSRKSTMHLEKQSNEGR